MILSRLVLQNFRSYTTYSCEFSPHTTVFVGPNAVGKTNILEAIAASATGKSFRAGNERDMIQRGNELARITTFTPDVKLELVVTSGVVSGQKAPLKKYIVNGISRRMVDFVGNLRVVVFLPEDLQLLTDSPSVRRKYLDRVLIQVDREYRRTLQSYERGLRQRNKVLEAIQVGRSQRGQLLFWDQLLIKAGNYITDARARYIEAINTHTEESLYPATTERPYVLYDKSVISESRLDQYKEAEVASKSTLVGPHRDDIQIYMGTFPFDVSNARMLAHFGSRGEQRMAVLFLKLSELAFIQKEAGDRPVLLLDDIFSELDSNHQGVVIDALKRQQTIITSADDSVLELLSSHNHTGVQVVQLFPKV